MKKYIICDFARSDWGKTQTLLKVIELIKKSTPPIIEELIEDKDKYVEFVINKRIVVINPQGDPGSYQEEGLNRAVLGNADIIICASRVRGATVDNIYKYSKSDYEVIWFSNFFADTNGLPCIPILHEITADAIVKLVFQLVK